MGRHLVLRVSLASVLGFSCWASPRAAEPPAAAPLPPGLAGLTWEISEAVLKHHIDPPARQQMLLDGLRTLQSIAQVPVPPGMARRASTITTPEQWSALLAELWPAGPVALKPDQTLEGTLVGGLLSRVPGGGYRMSAKEHNVQEQLAGNRYVGIHIQLSYEEKEKRAVIHGIVPGGPADRAGVVKEDRIEAIDGVETNDMKLGEVVDRLRGPSGTDVVVRVRRPGAKEARTLRMTRGPLFLPTLSGLVKQSSGDWDYRASAFDPVAYLKLRDISASTPRELQQQVESLRRQGFRALVLDLRGVHGSNVHPAVLLADSLLEKGRIGRIREADRVQSFDATPGSLCPDWPLAVLVDEQTSGSAEWFAGALQDNHRASLVGRATASAWPGRKDSPNPFAGMSIRSDVPIGKDAEHGYLSLQTGRLERGDGPDLEAMPAPLGLGFLEVGPRRPPNGPIPGRGVAPDVVVTRLKGGEPDRQAGGTLGEDAPSVDPWTDRDLNAAVKRLATSGGAF